MNAIEALRKALLRDIQGFHHVHDRTNLRPYEMGDDYRRIDWSATARKGQLYSYATNVGTNLTLASIVDTSASMLAGRRRSLSTAAEEARQIWRRLASPDDRYIDLSRDDVAVALEQAHRKLPRGTALLVISDCFKLVPGAPSKWNLPVLLNMTRRVAKKCDCILLLARDPWYDEFPLRGLHRIRDIESNASRMLFFGPRQRKRYHAVVREREDAILAQFASAGWRTGILTEDNGTEAIFNAFNIL